ncbi:MAG: hypothetical protein IJ179_00220 [Oscillospiraceae bacterium]|nr:hypothetical protein [Oscillospiraceae bacterium]
MPGKLNRSARWLAAVLALVLLFSALFIALEAHHDCQGDGCAICACISICQDLLQHLSVVALVLGLALLLNRAVRPLVFAVRAAAAYPTPITLKVKLSD